MFFFAFLSCILLRVGGAGDGEGGKEKAEEGGEAINMRSDSLALEENTYICPGILKQTDYEEDF